MLLWREVGFVEGLRSGPSIFLNGHELLLLMLLVVLVLLLGVVNMFVHGLHEGVYADDLLDRLFKCFFGMEQAVVIEEEVVVVALAEA